MSSIVEHVNLDVADLDAAIVFLQTAMPDFRVRTRQPATHGEWAHVGNDNSYLALNAPANRQGHGIYNHVGFAVDDLRGTVARLRAAGYRPGYMAGEIIEKPSRLRAYYLDPDGNEYEFVQYLTDDIAARNDYED